MEYKFFIDFKLIIILIFGKKNYVVIVIVFRIIRGIFLWKGY